LSRFATKRNDRNKFFGKSVQQENGNYLKKPFNRTAHQFREKEENWRDRKDRERSVSSGSNRSDNSKSSYNSSGGSEVDKEKYQRYNRNGSKDRSYRSDSREGRRNSQSRHGRYGDRSRKIVLGVPQRIDTNQGIVVKARIGELWKLSVP